jgi:CheY-like chemotaxis protein
MSRSVLVVEDYPDLRVAIADVLVRDGCVCECVNSDEAIARLEAQDYQTIIIGPRLSLTGDPVLHYLAEHRPGQLPHVVVMVNPGSDEESPDARCHVLTKPFSRDELLRQVAAST